MVATTSLLLGALATASTVLAAVTRSPPTIATVSSEATCQRMFQACVAESNQAVTNFFNTRSCVFIATCFPGTKPIDNAIIATYTAKNNDQNYVLSANQAKIPQSLFSFPINQQIWIDAWYGQLSQYGGPWPSNTTIVTDYFYRIQLWTASCGHSIYYDNFSAFFTSSSTGKSPGCPTNPFPNPPVISSEPSCQKMYAKCIEYVRYDATDFFSVKPCVFVATCFGGQRPVNSAIASVYSVKNPANPSNPPTAQSIARVQSDLFPFPMSRQQWIDAWFGFLSSVDGPYPSADIVINYFNRVREWTGFCTSSVPLQNFADYYQWSSVVSSGACRV